MPGLKSQCGLMTVLASQDVVGKLLSGAPASTNESVKASSKGKIEVPFFPISFRSGRIKRVVRSTFSAEVLAMVDGLLGRQLSEIVQRRAYAQLQPALLLCDCMSVVANCQSTCPHNVEKRLRLDLCSTRESIEDNQVNVRWIDTTEQMADGLTKHDAKLVDELGERLISVKSQRLPNQKTFTLQIMMFRVLRHL